MRRGYGLHRMVGHAGLEPAPPRGVRVLHHFPPPECNHYINVP